MTKKILFVKPPDRFLENEFIYQQLGPHYLQSYLKQMGILSDLLVLYEPNEVRRQREENLIESLSLEQLNMLYIEADGRSFDGSFNHSILENYDVVGMSVMSPQAPDAYLLNERINSRYPQITTVIGGSHPRYYQKEVASLPPNLAFDFIVPQDGWGPMYQIATGQIPKTGKSTILCDSLSSLTDIPAPSRPKALMERYNFNISGVPAYHTITALGCPFSCNFCESGREKVRKFSMEMIDKDLRMISEIHSELNHAKKAVMFFDDVGLMNPVQVTGLSEIVHRYGFTTWRAFTHAYLVVRFKEKLLGPFFDTGGRRIGIGLETGSQRSLDLINKRNGQKQFVEEHFDAVKIANAMGIAVDAFTMIYPWEDEDDLRHTTKMIEFIVKNPVNGVDELGRPMKNQVDSTIMTPFQGTMFYDMFKLEKMSGIKIKPNLDPGLLFYKGNHGGSGWPYLETRLPKERYEEVQTYRNSLRPKYR
ncbi:MAG: radical SAM protein [SAR324 cluster bacterium]|nr:radical SAM protein [SAR324 cluster bacterium]